MIKILCVGKIKESYLDDLINDYKKHKKNSLFLKKNAQKLASFEKYAYICNMKNLLAGDITKTIRTQWS